MPTTSDHPEPHVVLETASTHTPSSVLSHEDFLLFSIGLRLFGEERKQRFLAYLATLTTESQERKEETHDI